MEYTEQQQPQTDKEVSTEVVFLTKENDGEKSEQNGYKRLALGKQAIGDRLSLPPLGWISRSETVAHFRTSERTLIKLVDEERVTHPEWFGTYLILDKRGRPIRGAEHYSPELLNILTEKIPHYEVAPDGWKNTAQIVSELQIEFRTGNKILQEASTQLGEEMKVYLNPRNQPAVHFSPAVVLAAKEILYSNHLPIPDGWVTKSFFSAQYDASHDLVSGLINKFRDQYKDDIGMFSVSLGGKLSERYGPSLQQAINNEFENRQQPPEGWVSVNQISTQLDIGYDKAMSLFNENKDLYSDEIGVFRSSTGTSEYMSPKMQEVFLQYIALKDTYKDWLSFTDIDRATNKGLHYLQKLVKEVTSEHPEFITAPVSYLNATKGVLYHPDVLQYVLERIAHHSAEAPEGWLTHQEVLAQLKMTSRYLDNKADVYRESHPEWFGQYFHEDNRFTKFYHPDFVQLIVAEAQQYEYAPDGWLTAFGITKQLGAGQKTVQKIADAQLAEHPEWVQKYRIQSGVVRDHFHPDLVEIITAHYTEFEFAPDSWLTLKKAGERLSMHTATLLSVLNQYQESHPEWFAMYRVYAGESAKGRQGSGMNRMHYHIDLLDMIRESRIDRIAAPEGWLTKNGFMMKSGISSKMFDEYAKGLRETNPEWYRYYNDVVGKYVEHLHPELQDYVESFALAENSVIVAQEHERAIQHTLRDELDVFLDDIDVSHEQIGTPQDFKDLIGLFGASAVTDILYQLHPEYRKLPVPYVKSKLAEYLGDFLTVQGGLSLEGLEKGVDFLAHPSFQENLTEVLKEQCLRLLNFYTKNDLQQVSNETVIQFLNDIRLKSETFSTPELEKIIGDVSAYYELLFENIHKPSNFVDELADGRQFPDINQRINVQEIAFKRKMLIADEMGTGKSASVIMAKEIIGVKQALVIVPSNVIPVWQNYLSDTVESDGKQVGYFKPGQAPRILTVERLEDLSAGASNEYDYIIISQERLNEQYTAALGEYNYDMLIVDEMHKLKNISTGKRAESLLRLAEHIEGDDKYLALLSGTPVPNKVGDIALTLKLLYPEKFGQSNNKELVSQIINGDMLDLRGLLVPRMQMKGLSGNIDMPELHETTQSVGLSEREKEIYEILIEEDELTATEKLAILRQFSLNPRMLDATPNLVGSKVTQVGKELTATYATKNKVVMFVNGYIENVMRGQDTILNDLTVPDDVKVVTIDGMVSQQRRIEIQRELHKEDQKMLLVVSGQTADTGVDFSDAEEVYHYNEPWSVYDKQQQTSRVFRPGLKDNLTVRTFINEGTIERGIHENIGTKYTAVEKLLRGVPISEIEKNMLRRDEKQANAVIEVNPELAKYYFSAADKMAKMYGHVKELGEDNFRKFLSTYDKEYANSYADLVGSRSYQANVSRLSGSLIKQMVVKANQKPDNVSVLDLASGPEMLRRHIAEDLVDSVTSLDINQEHFKQAVGKTVIGSFVHTDIIEKSVDYVNLSLGLHYTSFVPSKGNLERLETFKEANRVLKVGGRMTIAMIHSLSLVDDAAFANTMHHLGFEIIREYTGQVTAGKNFQTQMITLQKLKDVVVGSEVLVKQIGLQGVKALKFKKIDSSLTDSRKIVKQVLLGDAPFNITFNDVDKKVLEEEESIISDMEILKKSYKSVENIPKNEIVQRGFSRIFNGKRYVLFRRLTTDTGAVAIR